MFGNSISKVDCNNYFHEHYVNLIKKKLILSNIEFDYFTRIVAHQLQLFGKLDCEVKA